MLLPSHRALAVLVSFAFVTGSLHAEPLYSAIDRHITANAKGLAPAAVADDAEFLRRVYLDLTGTIPPIATVRAFIADKATDKRAKLVDQLLSSPTYAMRMSEVFHLMFMERLGEHAEWTKYLRASFEKNKPWNVMSSEILRGSAPDETTRGAVFFYAKRLENYGQQTVDYSALARDVGRLFLGMDLRCAECHDHLFVNDYKQDYFKGLYAFFQNTALQDAKLPSIVEKPTTQKVAFSSVFKKVPKEIGPRVPGLEEVSIPSFPKGEEFSVKPDRAKNLPGVPKFSPLTVLAEKLPTPENPAFAKNAVNRLWFILMGRGIVHPLDLHHSANPPSHPELLDLLAKEFVEHQFDIKYILREIALSQAYQRSSMLPDGTDKLPPERFLVAIEKRVIAEQFLRSMLLATGEPTPPEALLTPLQTKFAKAYANPAREPEEEFTPSLRAALFVLNDPTVLTWLQPKSGNLIDRVSKLADANAMAEELYLAVLSRLPNDDEKKAFGAFMTKHADKKSQAITQFAWALLASTEFSVNH